MTRFNEFTNHLKLESLQKLCRENGHIVSYPKGMAIVQEGNICRHLGIVTSGYFKYITINTRGEECVTGFSFPGEVVTDYVNSYLFNYPSLTSIVAGCDSAAQMVSLTQAKEFLSANDPQVISHTAFVLLRDGYKRYLKFYKMTPAERYADLRRRISNIDIIPHKELASFLNISRRQFQRIRDNF